MTVVEFLKAGIEYGLMAISEWEIRLSQAMRIVAFWLFILSGVQWLIWRVTGVLLEADHPLAISVGLIPNF